MDVVRALYVRWISLFGTPEVIHSDRGTEFQDKIVYELCWEYGSQDLLRIILREIFLPVHGLQYPRNEGPFAIIRRKGECYTLKHLKSGKTIERKHKEFHACRKGSRATIEYVTRRETRKLGGIVTKEGVTRTQPEAGDPIRIPVERSCGGIVTV